VIVIPFQASHIEELATYGGQTWAMEYFTANKMDPSIYEATGPSFSGAVAGEIVGCAGLIIVHERRAITWALFSNKAPQHFISIHRAVAAFLRAQEIPRIEAYVDTEFPQAKRWVEALGFACECEHMRDFFPGGRAAALWTKFK
jgi:hypothetical protein